MEKAKKELEALKKHSDSLAEENKTLKAAPAASASTVVKDSPLKGDSMNDIMKDLIRLFTERNKLTTKAFQPDQFLRLLRTYAKDVAGDAVVSSDDISSCLTSFMISISKNQLKVFPTRLPV